MSGGGGAAGARAAGSPRPFLTVLRAAAKILGATGSRHSLLEDCGARRLRSLGARVALFAVAPPVARPAMAFRGAVADHGLVARVLAASRVERRPEPPDASYLRDLAASLYGGLADLIDRAGQRLHLPGWLLASMAALLVVAVAALLARAWLRGRRRAAARNAAGGEQGAETAGTDEGDAASDRRRRGSDVDTRDAAAWRLEIDRLLAQQRVAEALRATWWWLARSLAGSRAEPTWTGRELLRWSRREDLRPLVRQLDSMAYGPRPSRSDEVRGLAARLEAALG